MSDKYNELLLAALCRAGKPRTSGELLDEATGLALAEGWGSKQAAKLSRKGVAKRLQAMKDKGLVRTEGSTFDDDQGRMTPLFAPADGYDARALVPAPPQGQAAAVAAEAGSPLDGKTRTQILAMFDAQSELLAQFEAGMRMQLAHMQQMNELREKLRARLMAVGLEAA